MATPSKKKLVSSERELFLEKNWNNDISKPKEPRRILVSDDVKSLIMRSMPNLPQNVRNQFAKKVVGHEIPETHQIKTIRAISSRGGIGSEIGGSILGSEQKITQNDDTRRSFDTFLTIASTFGFNHHEGTDPKKELVVVKAILTRENILMKLRHVCEIILEKQFVSDKYGMTILDLMTKLRLCTLNYIEALSLWRDSIPNMDPTMPTPFSWEGDNYTIRVIYDIDFLSEMDNLVKSLKIDSMKLRANPLMLPNTLKEGNLWTDPHDRATEECQMDPSINYDERLRLRLAEKVLLLELENNAYNDPDRQAWDYITMGENSSFNEQSQTEYKYSSAVMDAAIEQQMQTKQQYNGNNHTTYNTNAPENNDFPESDDMDDFENPSSLRVSTYPVEDTIDGVGTFYEEFVNANTYHYNDPNLSSTPPEFQGDFIQGNDDIYEDNDVFSQESDYLRYKQHRGSVFIEPLDVEDVRLLITIKAPSNALLLASAVIQVFLAADSEVPDNITWSMFQDMYADAGLEEFTRIINSLDPLSISKFKIRAVKPFIAQLDTIVMNERKSVTDAHAPAENAAQKLVKYVQQVVLAAVEPVVKPSHRSRMADPLPIEGIKARQNMTSAGAVVGSAPGTGISSKRGSTSNDRSKSRNNKKNLAEPTVPKRERKVTSLELVARHVEIVSNYTNPLLLTLLSSQKNENSKKATFDPNALLDNGPKFIPERLVVKLYDLVTSQECSVPINIREYTLFLYELREKYGPDAVNCFKPSVVEWWIENICNVILVRYKKSNGTLSFSISKKAISKLVATSLGLVPSPLRDSLNENSEYTADPNQWGNEYYPGEVEPRELEEKYSYVSNNENEESNIVDSNGNSNSGTSKNKKTKPSNEVAKASTSKPSSTSSRSKKDSRESTAQSTASRSRHSTADSKGPKKVNKEESKAKATKKTVKETTEKMVKETAEETVKETTEYAVVSQVAAAAEDEGEVIADDTEFVLDSDPVEEYLEDESIIEIE
jgi:hypothetical protein